MSNSLTLEDTDKKALDPPGQDDKNFVDEVIAKIEHHKNAASRGWTIHRGGYQSWVPAPPGHNNFSPKVEDVIRTYYNGLISGVVIIQDGRQYVSFYESPAHRAERIRESLAKYEAEKTTRQASINGTELGRNRNG